MSGKALAAYAMRVVPDRAFPFVPKSTTKLFPGDFWGIPLEDGRWACGRVLQNMPKGMAGARVGFLGGLLDWVDASPPTAESIAGRPVVEQGIMHVLAITSTGGAILGTRSLDLDNTGPLLCTLNDMVSVGLTPVRKWTVQDRGSAPALGWWGYDIIQVRANRRFVLPGA